MTKTENTIGVTLGNGLRSVLSQMRLTLTDVMPLDNREYSLEFTVTIPGGFAKDCVASGYALSTLTVTMRLQDETE